MLTKATLVTRLACAVCITFFLMLLSLTTNAQNTKGTEFWVAEMPNLPTVNSPFVIAVANSSPVPANVIISKPDSLGGYITVATATIAPDGLQQFSFASCNPFIRRLPVSSVMTASTAIYVSNVYRITSDVKVVAFSFTPLTNVKSNDACLLLPKPSLGKKYFAGSYVSFDKRAAYASQFGIVATNPGVTNVKTYDATGSLVDNINLSQGQYFQRLNGNLVANDVTGWYIESSQPTAVFTGNQITAVGTTNAASDHLCEQALPVETLAKDYIAAPSANRPIGCTTCAPDIFRYVATEDNTVITTIPNVGTWTLNKGQFAEVTTNVPHIVNGTKPFYGYQYLVSQAQTTTVAADQTGDPSLLAMPVVQQFQYDYTFLVPQSFLYNYITVTAPAGTNIYMDGALVNGINWRNVGVLNAINYSVASIQITAGAHKIVGDQKFGIQVMSFETFASYAYLGGSGLEPINAGCISGGPYQVLSCRGANQPVNVQLHGTASCDNNASPSVQWSGANGVVFSDPNIANPVATVPGPGTYEITLKVLCGGNLTTCTSEIVVKEPLQGCGATPPPTIVPPPSIVVPADNGQNYASNVQFGTATYTAVGPATLVNDAPVLFPLGNTVVTWTVTDAYGRTASGTQNVFVGSLPPTIIAPPAVTVVAGYNGYAMGVDLLANGNESHTSTIDPTTVSNNGLTQYPIGTTNVTWTVTDGLARTASDVQQVIVVAPRPVIAPPADITISNDPGMNYSSNVVLVNPVFSAVGPYTLTNDAPASGQFPLGNTIVKWTLTDAYGNTVTTSNTVTVVSAPPTIVAPPTITVTAGYNGFASIAYLGTATTTVSVNPASVSNDGLSQYPIGTTNVTWTVTDGLARTASDVQQIIVVAPRPVIAPPADITISNDPGMNYSSNVVLVNPVFSAVGPYTLTNDAPASGQFPLGNTIVKWTLTDAYGNIVTTSNTVTVVSAPPTIVAPAPITVTAGYNGFASVPNLGTPTTTVSVNPANVTKTGTLSQYPIGSTMITWTVTDGIGRTASDVQKVYVLVPRPTIAPPADVTVSNDAGKQYATGINLGTPSIQAVGPYTLTNDAPANGQWPLGTTTITWTLKDAYGNVVTTTQKVTVTSAPPTITPPANITVTAAAGQTSATISNIGTATYTVSVNPATLTNNGIASGVYPVGSTTVTWTIKDGLGRTASGTQTITVNPSLSCSFVSSITSIPTDNTPTGGNPNNLYIGYGAQSTKLQVNVPNTGGPYTFQWTGTKLSSMTSAAPIFTPGTVAGSYSFTVTIKNASGCTSTATISICVRDVRSLDKNGNWDGKKVIVCHLPPGNIPNVQYIDVSINAVPTHVPNHGGDGLGNSCVQPSCTSPYARGTAPVVETFAVSLYPNPAANQFSLTVKSDDKYTDINIRIIDAFGRTVEMIKSVTAGRTVLFGDNYANGAYYAEVIQGSDKKIIPIVKAK